MNLNEEVRIAKEYDEKILFDFDDVSIDYEDDREFYIDRRTKYDMNLNIHFVKPVTFDRKYYRYVCPNCQKIHAIHKSNVYIDFYPACFGMVNQKRKSGIQRLIFKGEVMKLPINKIKLITENSKGGNNMRIQVENIKGMEVVANENGDPIVAVTCKDGQEHQFPISKSNQIHICNEFLRSLDLGIEIEFNSFTQYGSLIKDCAAALMIRNGVNA